MHKLIDFLKGWYANYVELNEKLAIKYSAEYRKGFD